MIAQNLFLEPGKMDLDGLMRLQEKPLPYTPGEPLFWTDPHIAQQMLQAHLNPNSDAASRRPEIIVRIVDWIVSELGLQPGDALLDLGCGPGLYAARLAHKGLRVTGVDFSSNSLDYARRTALEQGLTIDYRCQDYLTLQDEACYDAVLLIYGDFCPLSPAQRSTLLANIGRALKPDGALVFDVTRAAPERPQHPSSEWYADAAGFWRPTAHLVLEQRFTYPEQNLLLDQYAVIEAGGELTVYRVWRQDYTSESIQAELLAAGFDVASMWADLTGAPLAQAGEWLGIVARKQERG